MKTKLRYPLIGAVIFFLIFLPRLPQFHSARENLFPLIDLLWGFLGNGYANDITFVLVGGTPEKVGLLDEHSRFLANLYVVIGYTLIGALVGWVYGIIRSKRNNQ